MHKDHDDYLRDSINLALSAGRMGAPPFAAVITIDGVTVAKEVNQVINSLDPTQHAEIAAIRSAARTLGTIDLHNCVLYTSCEPCVMCRGALLWARLESVYFSATREIAAKYGFTDGYAKIRGVFSSQCFVQDLEELGEEPFIEWNKCEQKLGY